MIRVSLICFALWAAVVGAVWAWQGGSGILTQIALFFTKAAFVTLGGAYAVLSYINEVAVGSGWLALKNTLPSSLMMRP